jgi:hypothetical protein
MRAPKAQQLEEAWIRPILDQAVLWLTALSPVPLSLTRLRYHRCLLTPGFFLASKLQPEILVDMAWRDDVISSHIAG